MDKEMAEEAMRTILAGSREIFDPKLTEMHANVLGSRLIKVSLF